MCYDEVGIFMCRTDFVRFSSQFEAVKKKKKVEVESI